jgi:hypothetical protein
LSKFKNGRTKLDGAKELFLGLNATQWTALSVVLTAVGLVIANFPLSNPGSTSPNASLQQKKDVKHGDQSAPSLTKSSPSNKKEKSEDVHPSMEKRADLHSKPNNQQSLDQQSASPVETKRTNIPRYYILSEKAVQWDEMIHMIQNDPKAAGYILPTVEELKMLVGHLINYEFQKHFFWSNDRKGDKISIVNLASGTVKTEGTTSLNHVILVQH